MKDSLRDLRFAEPVLVVRPTLPPLHRYQELLERIWSTRWLTNKGPLHEEFEARLQQYLQVEHLSLLCNGTVGLLLALQALRLNSGEVITTPFTFPATTHVLHLSGIRPVFADITEHNAGLDPAKIERHLHPDTKAILAVHAFGLPSAVEEIQAIADRHGLYVLYDAAHAFHVRIAGRSILEHGDLSVLSFHATKGFSTVEGGAIKAGTAEQKARIDSLKNFGIADEETVIGPGINGKLNELQAAFGLLSLEGNDQEVARRRSLTERYRRHLRELPGIRVLEPGVDVDYNYAYLAVLVDEAEYGMDRDALYRALKWFNVHTRKYFHPLCSQFPCYSALPSADPRNLPVATRVAQQVLCLPLYGTLEDDTVDTICTLLHELPKHRGELAAATGL